MQERKRKAQSADSSSFLPARFDWSIMGCTILLRALMNLKESRKKRERKATFKSSVRGSVTDKRREKTVLLDVMAALATESVREASTAKQADADKQTKGQLCADLRAQQEILLMCLMIYSPLF